MCFKLVDVSFSWRDVFLQLLNLVFKHELKLFELLGFLLVLVDDGFSIRNLFFLLNDLLVLLVYRVLQLVIGFSLFADLGVFVLDLSTQLIYLAFDFRKLCSFALQIGFRVQLGLLHVRL